MKEIDIVILWVDGNDLAWRNEFDKYNKGATGDARSIRFRDWETLKYIFRGIESFAPWVRKVHLVTWGHLPKWLNQKAKKLSIVRHDNYIEKRYLPIFNANPLEISLHRIPDLAESFIFFNDDFFLVAPVCPERFFKNGLPRDAFVSNAISSGQGVGHFVLNSLDILNHHFKKGETFRRYFFRVFHPLNGMRGNFQNLALLPWPRFTGFVDPHQPQPFLRSTFEEVWRLEGEALEKTMKSRFRSCEDLNQYLFRYWQLAKGEFEPVSFSDTRYITLSHDIIESGQAEKIITEGQYKMLCLNDSDTIADGEPFEKAKERIKSAFERLLPKPSSFEVEP
jgi:hypothetical protein